MAKEAKHMKNQKTFNPKYNELSEEKHFPILDEKFDSLTEEEARGMLRAFFDIDEATARKVMR